MGEWGGAELINVMEYWCKTIDTRQMQGKIVLILFNKGKWLITYNVSLGNIYIDLI